MNFIDRTGHIFSLTHYDQYPIGYEYQETPYIFWFDSENSSKLSVNNYYFKPIRIVTKVKENDEVHVNIKIENSNIFHIIDSDIIENKLLNINSLNDSIELFESEIKSSNEITYTEDLSTDNYKGALVDESDDENPIEIGTETFYINVVSNKEYNGDVYNSRDLLDVHYLDSDNEYHDVDPNENILLGKIEIGTIFKYVRLITDTREVLVTEENRDTLTNIHIQKELYLINTFYVAVNSPEAGIWSTNVLINIDDEWCPVTVSAEIIDEAEELIVNGQNFGIYLPKEITRAIYSSNYNIDVPDEKIYYQKLKEYLMNYMQLKGEVGNYRSAINSLKWFEWGDKLTISKLIRNDNRIQRQYVKDFFDIINDNIYSYQLFKDTSLLSIELKLTEDGDNETQDLSSPFWGEGKPVVRNNFNVLKEVSYDEQEYKYYKGYFNFTFNDLGLKLAALKYYYEKYFLPLYIKIHEIYMSQHVYTNDIKLINKVSHGITATPVFVSNFKNIENIKNKDIVFNNNYSIIYFNRYYKKDFNSDYSETNRLYIDKNFNEFSNYTYDFVSDENNKEIYYEINETCLRIPIEFPHIKGSTEYYNVNLILSRYIDSNNDNIVIDETSKLSSNLFELLKTNFSFIQTDNSIYQSLILYPKLINEINSNKFDSVYWLNNKFRIDLVVNNKLYNFIFTAKMPEFNIEMGTLQYKYDDTFKQISEISEDKIKFNASMYLPNLVNVNNIDFDEEIIQMSNNIIDYINVNYKEKVKFLNKKYLNACHLLDLTDLNGNIIPYNNQYNDIQKLIINGVPFNDIINIELFKRYPELKYTKADFEKTEEARRRKEEKEIIIKEKTEEIKTELSIVYNTKIMMTWNEMPLYASANQNLELYRNFFNDDGTYKKYYKEVIYDNINQNDMYYIYNDNTHSYVNVNYQYIQEHTDEQYYIESYDLESLITINNHKYDLYLMHDWTQWYVVLISKQPVDYTSEKEKKFKFNDGTKKVKIGNYLLTYNRSDRKFLINRYIYIPSEGINHFKKDDVIVASLKNNDKLCFKLSAGSKWNIIPLSLKMQNVNPVHSSSELAIISIPDKFKEYEKGYYSLSIEYCIDDYAMHIYTNNTQFRIDD